MSEIVAVELDLEKLVSQAHWAEVARRTVVGKRLRRDQVLAFIGELLPSLVVVETSGRAHCWGRKIGKLVQDLSTPGAASPSA